MAVKRHQVHWDITAQNATDSAMRAVEGNLQRVNGAAEQLKRTFGSALVATTLIAMTRESARAAMEAEQQQARLTAVLRATGHQAGLTRREMEDLADATAETTPFDDESAREAMANLLKFGNIQGDVFREGLKLSADLAAFMGTNIPEAAQMIGKSLQSPTEGLQMMERQFGKLTATQKSHIEELVKQGRAIEAQNAVLDIWRSKVGGTAELMNTGLKKSTTEVTKAWSEMLEALGRTETFGGTARDILGGIRDILRDIKDLAAGGRDPMKVALGELETLNDEIQRLEGSRASPTQAQRAGLGAAADKAAREQIEGKIAELKEERQKVMAVINALNQAGDPGAMDARDRRLRTPGPVELGGDSTDKAEADRTRQLREQDMRNLVRYAEEVFDSSEKLIYTWDGFGNRITITREEFKKLQDDAQRGIDKMVESAELSQDAADNLVYTWDRAGNRVAMTRDAFDELAKQQKRNEEMAKDLGFTFTSAFEDAIVKGGELRDILKGLEQDIARIILRRTVTEPLAAALSAAIGGIFGGGGGPEELTMSARGGHRAAGQLLLVGEEGPELFRPDSAGTVIPNDRLTFTSAGEGSVNIVQNIHIDSRSDQASIMAAMQMAKEQAKADIHRSIRSGSRRYTS